jgi:hypothetical protein
MTQALRTRAADRSRSRGTTKQEDVVTIITSTWLIIGLFVDGYAHQHLITAGESFITPWHGIFYAGFAATATWLAVIVRRRRGQRIRERIPDGYEPALVAIVGFAVGGAGDLLWHTLFGVETGIDALLSPTHLMLMASLLVIVTTPYRVAIHRDRSDRAEALPLISLTIGAALVAFFLNFVWGLGDAGFAHAYEPATGGGELYVIAGVATALVTTAFFAVLALFVTRLGRTSPPTFAVIFGVIALAVHVAFDEQWIGVAAAVGGGLLLDVVLRRPYARLMPIAAAASAGGMWLIYFGLAALDGRVAWPVEIWTGTVMLCGLATAAIAQATASERRVGPASGTN